jgi:Flp pilus assembly protein TadB
VLAEQDAAPQSRDPQAKKGRPTPKRSQAEANRRQRVTVPKDRKEAAKQSRDQLRTQREKQRQALIDGDERYLPLRDKGPVRKFARDYMDSRWAVAEFFLPFAVVVIALSIVPVTAVQIFSELLFALFLILAAADFVRHGMGLRRALENRFPGEKSVPAGVPGIRGTVRYGLMRTLQLRRMRLPKPQVNRGEHP